MTKLKIKIKMMDFERTTIMRVGFSFLGLGERN